MTRGLIAALVLALAAPALAASAGDKLPRFEAPVVKNGKTSTLDSHRRSRPTVYLFVGTKCATTEKYAERLRELEKGYGDRVDFVYIYPNKNDSPSEKVAFHSEKKLAGGLVDDQGAKIARLLGATRTAEAFVVDGDKRIVYHGAIDDDREARNIKRRHLALALDELLGGKQVSTPRTDVHA
jgi:thiol-disulfide isomerase/thioredoxin